MMARDILESSDARVELVVRSPQAEFNLDVLATYSKTEPFLASPDVRRSFLEKVGIFVVWPYLRAELFCALCQSRPGTDTPTGHPPRRGAGGRNRTRGRT